MKGKKNMQNIFDKRDFYRAMLRDRLPIARINFILGRESGTVELYATPLGTVFSTQIMGDKVLKDIKIYDKKRGSFFVQNVFCGDNLVRMEDGSVIGVSGKVQIDEVIGRDALIKFEGTSIVARIEMIPRRDRTVDKSARLVYN